MEATLRFDKIQIRMTDLGEESCLPDLLGISILQNELTFELGEKEEIFEGYGRIGNLYPYRQYDNYGRELKTGTAWTAVLENDHLKAVFLPEYGGRLWELWDKSKGQNLLYTNDVIKFRNLASRNAWFSGGVEWNIGIIGHSPFTTETMHIARTQTDQGDPVLRMYQYERIRKVVWQMDFWLEKDPYLNCAVRIYNESEDVIPMYWWSNIAVPEHEGGRVIVPAQSAYTSRRGVVYKVDIPMVEGVDITDYQKIPYSVDYFFDIPEQAPKYIANVNAQGYGLLQVSSSRLRSRKLFSWGHQAASGHWQEYLTDRKGPYIEIQAGLGKTQYGCIPMAPHTTWEWIERYGAVQIPQEDVGKFHLQRMAEMTRQVIEKKIPESLDELAVRYGSFAKKAAVLIRSGKQHGALREPGKNTKHLRFELESEALRKWNDFFQTGILHQPDPAVRPDEFMIDQADIAFMERACGRMENAGNWYAFYHLGLGYFVKGAYECAIKAFEKSDLLEPNPWARHAMSCAYLKVGAREESVRSILAGMKLRSEDPSYLKEGFRILTHNRAFGELCGFYRTMEKKEQEIGKLKYYYTFALARMGKYADALYLLEQDKGIEIEDIREGETSVQDLWEESYEMVHGEKGKVPYRYQFRMSEG